MNHKEYVASLMGLYKMSIKFVLQFAFFVLRFALFSARPHDSSNGPD